MIRNFLMNFMRGRYGPDRLGVAIVVVSIILELLYRIFGLGLCSVAAYALVFYALFRFLSHNIPKRRAENDRFTKYWWPVRQKIMFRVEKIKGLRKYKYFRCPSCHNNLRVPRGKGRINITCPKCGERFQRKT